MLTMSTSQLNLQHLYLPCLICISFIFALLLVISVIFSIKLVLYFGYMKCWCKTLNIFAVLTFLTTVGHVTITLIRVYILYSKSIHCQDSNPLWSIVSNIVYYTSLILFYIVLIIRLQELLSSFDSLNYNQFKHNQYRISKSQQYLLIWMIILDIVLIGVGLVEFVRIWSLANKSDNSSESSFLYLIAALSVFIINDFIINGLILYIALSRLYQMIYELDEYMKYY